MDIIALILLGVTGIVLSLTLKQHSREFAVLVSITICIVILTAGASLLSPAVTFINTLAEKTDGEEYVKCLLKCVGICCLASFAQDLCIDNNERSIASSIELAARAAVAVTVLPILKSLAEIAFSLG